MQSTGPHAPSPTDTGRLRDGFRHRGRDITRLEVFVDAAFAFAVTLLVVSIDAIPDSIDGLVAALKGAPAFGVSLIMIALFWAAHARWSRRYGLDDRATTVLSILFVFLILLYVYPLKMTFSSFFGWISNGWIPFGIRIEKPADILSMFAIYGGAFMTLSLCLLGLYLNAWRQRGELALDASECAITGGEIATYLFFAAVALLSTVVALSLPETTNSILLSLPGMTYFLLAFSGLIDAIGRRWGLRRHQSSAG